LHGGEMLAENEKLEERARASEKDLRNGKYEGSRSRKEKECMTKAAASLTIPPLLLLALKIY
jgi:hypothetical protein